MGRALLVPGVACAGRHDILAITIQLQPVLAWLEEEPTPYLSASLRVLWQAIG